MTASGNTPPAISLHLAIRALLWGIDSLYFGFMGIVKSDVLDEARSGRAIYLAGHRFVCRQSQRGVYEVSIRNDYLDISIGNRIIARTSPQAYVQVRSLFIRERGLRGAYDYLIVVIGSI